MLFLKTGLLVLSAALGLTAAQNNAPSSSITLQTHSLYPPYIDDDLQNRWFDFGGDAIINTNKHVRLTSNRPSQVGYLWSRLPLATLNFEIEFEYNVDGPSGHLFGDGFAMWLAKERASTGPVFGSVNGFDGLGIFFDTYDNERSHKHSFPYVQAMIGDGYKHYENDKDGSSTEAAGCEADFRGKTVVTKARLTYYKNNYLRLELQHEKEDEWTECFKIHDVKLPDQVYLGFTAHTGEISDNHDIISVTTKTLPPIAIEPKHQIPQTGKKPKSSSGGGGFLWFLFKMVAAAGLVGVMFVAYRVYDKSGNMKRF
ncbi:hypothetical protein INT43_002653 [Umbelopsis isabellina]|uniref:L-type lectin-like domain-containing protein n=1 Tax=Mortierella isabellina TaxID=91625 RepID=A0A8H7UK83_MORIS|nr:hypothetical protein INT43_002653 [Umbelopsis isabellina]